MKFVLRVLPVVAAAVLAAFAAPDASAGLVIVGSGTSAGGNTIAARADISFSSNTMTVKLTNLTPKTFAATELLAGFDFTLSGGLSVNGALTSGSTPHAREVTGTGAGAFSDTAGAVNLLTINGGGPTWSIETNGSEFRLSFNPDSKYSIIGNPVGNAYADANGSIVDNSGHNPFSVYEATFTFALSGNGSDSNFSSGTFLFNTANFTQVTGVPDVTITPFSSAPVPTAAWAGLALLVALGVGYSMRKRRRAAGL